MMMREVEEFQGVERGLTRLIRGWKGGKTRASAEKVREESNRKVKTRTFAKTVKGCAPRSMPSN
jgi:hypothetical protein